MNGQLTFREALGYGKVTKQVARLLRSVNAEGNEHTPSLAFSNHCKQLFEDERLSLVKNGLRVRVRRIAVDEISGFRLLHRVFIIREHNSGVLYALVPVVNPFVECNW